MNHNVEGEETLWFLQGRAHPCYRNQADLTLLLAVQRWNYRCHLTILVTKVPEIDSELMIRTGETRIAQKEICNFSNTMIGKKVG